MQHTMAALVYVCVCVYVQVCVCVWLLNARFAVYVVSDKLPAAEEAAARLTRKLLKVLTAIQADMSTPLPGKGGVAKAAAEENRE